MERKRYTAPPKPARARPKILSLFMVDPRWGGSFARPLHVNGFMKAVNMMQHARSSTNSIHTRQGICSGQSHDVQLRAHLLQHRVQRGHQQRVEVGPENARNCGDSYVVRTKRFNIKLSLCERCDALYAKLRADWVGAIGLQNARERGDSSVMRSKRLISNCRPRDVALYVQRWRNGPEP